jgi:hypothetical protein
VKLYVGLGIFLCSNVNSERERERERERETKGDLRERET